MFFVSLVDLYLLSRMIDSIIRPRPSLDVKERMMEFTEYDGDDDLLPSQ